MIRRSFLGTVVGAIAGWLGHKTVEQPPKDSWDHRRFLEPTVEVCYARDLDWIPVTMGWGPFPCAVPFSFGATGGIIAGYDILLGEGIKVFLSTLPLATTPHFETVKTVWIADGRVFEFKLEEGRLYYRRGPDVAPRAAWDKPIG